MECLDEQKEWYFYFESCIQDLNQAWVILGEIRENPENPLCSYAFKLALIEYSKPYLFSKGIVATQYRLPETFLPLEQRALHDRIINARKRILAHSDIGPKDPRPFVGNINGKKFASFVQNIITGTEEFVNLDSIIELIQKTLLEMYGERDRLEAELPFSHDE